MVEGVKTAIAVQAPAVFRLSDENESDNVVTGSCAPELANSMFQTIATAYPKLVGILETSWQGCVLDGQYQAKGFAEKLTELLKKPKSEFFSVIWDAPHWVNLAIDDVIVGKTGVSQKFRKRLIGM